MFKIYPLLKENVRNIQEKLSLTYFFYIKVDSFWIYCCLHSFLEKLQNDITSLTFMLKVVCFTTSIKITVLVRLTAKRVSLQRNVFSRGIFTAGGGGLCAHTRKKKTCFPAANGVSLQQNGFSCSETSFPVAQPVSLQQTQFPCNEPNFPAAKPVSLQMYSSMSLLLVGDNSLMEELWCFALNWDYYSKHDVFK